MQRDEKIAYDQGVIEEKNKIVKSFIENVDRLLSASKEDDIAKYIDSHNQLKKQLASLRENPGLCTNDDVDKIVNAYRAALASSTKKSRLFNYEYYHEGELESIAWKQYAADLSLPELVKSLPEKLMRKNPSEEDEQARSDKEEDDDATLFVKVNRVIKGYESQKVSQEDIAPLVSALVDYYQKIMNTMAEQNFQSVRDLLAQRKSIEQIFGNLRDFQLISGNDALRIGMAYGFESSISTYPPDKKKAGEQSEMWKSYAAKVGSQFAQLEEKKGEDKKMIYAVWQQFQQETAPKKNQPKLFQDGDWEKVRELQKQLDTLTRDSTTSSTKPMLQLIGAFYLQREIKGPKDSFLNKLSEVLIDILIKLASKDKNIEAILQEEATIANQGEKPANLKESLLKSPKVLKGVLAALHITTLAQPELDRKSTFGPHFKTEL